FHVTGVQTCALPILTALTALYAAKNHGRELCFRARHRCPAPRLFRYAALAPGTRWSISGRAVNGIAELVETPTRCLQLLFSEQRSEERRVGKECRLQ